MSAEFLAELREWIALFGLSKLEVFGLFILCLVFYRLPVVLKHWNERYAIRRDFEARAKKLENKIEQEKVRRLERAKKRER